MNLHEQIRAYQKKTREVQKPNEAPVQSEDTESIKELEEPEGVDITDELDEPDEPEDTDEPDDLNETEDTDEPDNANETEYFRICKIF